MLIAIVDNDEREIRAMKEHLLRYQQQKKVEIQISIFSNGVEAIEHAAEGFDLMLMDIEMPLMNGMEAARAIRQSDNQVLLIFATKFSHYAIQGYEVGAFDYLLKPVQENRLFMTLDRARRCLPMRNDTLMINTANGMVRTAYSRIIYIEVNDHKLMYHTRDGIITARETMQHAEEQLHSHGFSRPGNSYLVNLAHVRSVRDNRVLIDDIEISMGRSRKSSFLNDLSSYFGGV